MAPGSKAGEQLQLPLLSWRTHKIWVFVCQYTMEHGYSPSMKEIREAVGLRSSSTVSYHLRILEELGYIERYRWAPRKIAILEKPWHSGQSSGRPGPT